MSGSMFYGETMNMQRFIMMMLLGVIIFLMAGCAKKETVPEIGDVKTQTDSGKLSLQEIRKEAENLDVSYKNLDFSNTKIAIPKVDEVYDLTFPVSTDSFERQVEKFEENIRKYEGLPKDVDLTQYMTVMYWDIEQNDRLSVPLNEVTDQQKETLQYLGYNDGTCSELIVFSDFMLEMGDHAALAEVTGDHMEFSEKEYGFEGNDLGTLVKRYDLSKDDISGISYHLADGDVALSDAISYVEKHMKEDYYFVGSEILDYHVFGVEVRQLTDDVYEYQFDVATSYQGLLLNKDDSSNAAPETASEDEDSLKPEPYGANHLVTMLYKDRLEYMWSCFQNFESVDVNNTYKSILSLEDACRLLSKYVSQYMTLEIGSIELIYHTEFEYESEEKRDWGYIQSIHARPAYHFSVSNSGITGHEKMYFNVDAVSGEIIPMAF